MAAKEKIAIIVDSTGNIPEKQVADYNLHVIPLIVNWEGESFRDGIDLKTADFYRRLAHTEHIPTTSQPSPAEFFELYNRVAQTADSILCLTISTDLSGTYASATAAAGMMGDYPLEVIDTRSASMGLGYIAIAAARAVEAGASFSEVVELARALIDKIEIMFVVDTLEFLHRGGRIGGAQRLIGSLLSFKPLLEVQNGRIDALGRVRTKRKAMAHLVEVIQQRMAGKKDLHLAIVHASAPEDAHWLGTRLHEELNPVELLYTELSPVIGTHVGPGTVGVGGYGL